ncbi:MAG: endonuclease MutS2 [Nitrospinales bacterium]
MTAAPPYSDSAPLLQKSAELLGWGLIRHALADLAYAEPTRARCLALRPEPDFETAQKALRKTGEMAALSESGEALPFSSFEDILPILEEIETQGIIEPAQGMRCLKLLRLTKSIKEFFAERSGSPLLKEDAAKLDPLPPLRRELDRCIDDEGEIKENATPELRQAVRAVRAAKEKLDRAVANLLASSALKESVQDSYATEREGRLVLPIKAEYKSRVDGIVHDTSGSGATLYIEPARLVPLNNQLKISRIKVEQEKLNILRALARSLADQQEPLRTNQEVLAALDLVHAKSRLAQTMQAHPCPLNREGRVQLKQARNPELVLNRQEVTPNDLCWEKERRIIVISGPNTGGKTVTLKTLGLMALMARAGLFLPAAEGSEIGFFSQVYADIGDEQSIRQSLSTYSAHLGKIVSILRQAAPGSLILLDELGIATDPVQGAALAEAILMELKRKGVTTLVSTHFLSLKILAQTQEGFLNASAQFDLDTLKPTYKLVFGAPGGSATLETAERLGLPLEIVRKSREICREKDIGAEKLLQTLHRQKLELEREKEILANQAREAEKLMEERRAITQRLRVEEQLFQKSKAKRLQGALKDAKTKIQKIMQEIKKTGDVGKIRKLEKQIYSIARVPPAAVALDLEGWDVPSNRLKKGDAVMLETYGAIGELLDSPRGKDKVRVKLGNLETAVDPKRLRGYSKAPAKPEARPKAVKVDIAVESSAGSGSKYSCDLRGLRAEEAEKALETFIDHALVNRMSRIKIIHGHGTGVIKKLVRDYLESGGIGEKISPGSREEGGDGVTIVEF